MAFAVDPVLKKTLREEGTVKAPGLLDPDQLARIRACYDWSLANPGPLCTTSLGSTSLSSVDNFNPEGQDRYRDTVKTLPLAPFLREVWDSEHVWYYAEEVYCYETDGDSFPGVFWHQDFSYLPWRGEHWANCWITFESIPRSHTLEVVRGSHHGTLYNGTTFDENDPTIPLWGDAIDLPRLPPIAAERRADPSSWDVVSFDIEPGDVMFLHPGSLHGGGPVDEQVPQRHTLVLRFFGDDATWTDLPEAEGLLTPEQAKVTLPPWVKRGRPGEPVGSSQFLQVL